MSRLRRSNNALQLLGGNVRHGWFVDGYLQTLDGNLAQAKFRFHVQGGKRGGTVEALLGSVEGTWVFRSLTLLADNAAVINLLDAPDDPPREMLVTPQRIYLVPIGRMAKLDLTDLPQFYKSHFGLEVAVLPAVQLESWVEDAGRGQLIAEELVLLMQRRLPALARNPHAVLIGITDDDMYFRERDWAFTYTYWDGERGGVVSSARFHPTRDGDDPVLKVRVRKMISRVIGFLALRLPRSDDPSSVLAKDLYGSISADLMSDNFDGLGSIAVIDNFVSAPWLPSLPPRIIAEKISFDGKAVDGSYPCLLIQHKRDGPGVLSRCFPQLLTDRAVDELEIDLRTGRLRWKETDLVLKGPTPVAVTRCYQPWDINPRTFGYNTSFAWDMFPSGSRNPYSEVGLNLCAHRLDFERISEGASYTNAVFEHRQTATPFLRARFAWAGNGWNLDLADRTHMFFPESYNGKRAVDGAVVEFQSSSGAVIKIQRDKARNLTGLFRTPDEFLIFDYDSRNRLIRARDHRNRAVFYSYDLAGRLVRVRKEMLERRYSYYGTDLMSVEENGTPALSISYTRGRIREISILKAKSYKFRYDYDPRENSRVVRSYVTDPDGHTTRFDIAAR